MGEERQDPSGGLMYNQPPATDENYTIYAQETVCGKTHRFASNEILWLISLKQLVVRALVCTIVVKTSIVHPEGPGIFQLRCSA